MLLADVVICTLPNRFNVVDYTQKKYYIEKFQIVFLRTFSNQLHLYRVFCNAVLDLTYIFFKWNDILLFRLHNAQFSYLICIIAKHFHSYKLFTWKSRCQPHARLAQNVSSFDNIILSQTTTLILSDSIHITSRQMSL